MHLQTNEIAATNSSIKRAIKDKFINNEVKVCSLFIIKF